MGMIVEIDADNELDVWWDSNTTGFRRWVDQPHRCPPDMPPCPECEVLIEEEEYREQL